MKLSTKASIVALAIGIAGAQPASAAFTSADPWGTSVLTDFAYWDVIDSVPTDATPDGAGTFSAATLTENTGTGFLTGGGLGGNVYSFSAATDWTASLTSATTTGLYDIYLRTKTQGTLPDLTSALDGVSVSAVLQSSTTGTQGTIDEYYWLWSGVSAASTYTFSFDASAAHMALDEVQLAVVAAPVPEPESYAMMLAGLGMMGFIGRRRLKK